MTFMECVPLTLRLHGLKTTFVCISEGPAFPPPVWLLVEQYGMIVISTHPAFPSAPAIRAKTKKKKKWDEADM